MTARQPARAVFFQTASQRTGAGFGGGRLNTDSAAPISLPPHAKRRRPPPLSPIRRDEQIFFDFLFAATQENECRAHFISERPVIE